MQEDKHFSLPQREYVIPNQHKYALGDKVRNINNADWNLRCGQEGVIIHILPFGHLYPAYDVQYSDGMALATSERSIERIEKNSGNTTK